MVRAGGGASDGQRLASRRGYTQNCGGTPVVVPPHRCTTSSLCRGAAAQRALAAPCSALFGGVLTNESVPAMQRGKIRVPLCVISALLGTVSARGVAPPPPHVAYVDTRIGTGGSGFGIGSLNPGASYPFGALRLGPDTMSRADGIGPIWFDFDHYGGYYALVRRNTPPTNNCTRAHVLTDVCFLVAQHLWLPPCFFLSTFTI
ncbi:hypothetical protein EON66_00210 [archaeon]|nr:MAG: hypothetical protein EON66_00210 [archaeon]